MTRVAKSEGFSATLFDFNGVLVDDERVHLAAFQAVLAPLGVVLTEADYWESYLGCDDRGGFRKALESAQRDASEAEVTRLVEAKRPVYRALAERELTVFPGAAEVVRARAAAGPVGIVSGALEEEVRFGLDALGVRACVAFIVAAEQAPRSKPDPMGYLLGVEALTRLVGAEAARRAIVVEDSLDGIRSGKAAGLTVAAVAHTYPAAELAGAGADAVFPALANVTSEALAALAHGAFRRDG